MRIIVCVMLATPPSNYTSSWAEGAISFMRGGGQAVRMQHATLQRNILPTQKIRQLDSSNIAVRHDPCYPVPTCQSPRPACCQVRDVAINSFYAHSTLIKYFRDKRNAKIPSRFIIL